MEDFLSCNICFIRYDESLRAPRQLPCQHIVCSSCLSQMIKKDSSHREFVECPTCREKVYKHLTEIPKSLVMLQLLDAAKSQPNLINQSSQAHSSNMPNRQWNNNNPNVYNNIPNVVKPQPAPPPPPPPVQAPQWNYRTHLQSIFNEMDINRDGSITAIELQQTLRRAQAGNEFNIKTVELLISRYDKNGDKQISFDEFLDLFNSLNEEYESFLMMDADGSGYIDFYEFKESLSRKGHRFSDSFYQYIMHEITGRTGKPGIQFDNYIRVAARFDYLCHFYHNTPYFHRNSLEEYLRKTFFQDFW